MLTILITGGTGLVGEALTTYLVDKGYHVIILTRSLKNKSNSEKVSYAEWNVKNNSIDVNAVQSADYIIHLAGAGVVDHKWTEAYKKEIVESRTKSSKLITDTLKNNTNKIKAIVSASAIGWYGKDKDAGYSFVETDAPSNDFLGNTCKLWEESLADAETSGVRVCKLRTGIVLSSKGGALEEFKKPVKFGLAGILSNGKQVISWIHIDDLCRMYLYAIENTQLSGSYNAVAPRPVSNKALTLMLAKSIRGNHFIPLHVPRVALKIMMGKRSVEVLKSTTVSASKIKNSGFIFLYPSIEAALQELSKK